MFSPGLDGNSPYLDIRNFEWNGDAYTFPYINDSSETMFYMEMRDYPDRGMNADIDAWVNRDTTNYEGPEKVQRDGNELISGDLLSESSLSINGSYALQRDQLSRELWKDQYHLYLHRL